MTASIKEQVLAAFYTQLQTIEDVEGLQFQRNPVVQVQVFPCVVMHDGSASYELLDVYHRMNRQVVEVEIYCTQGNLSDTQDELDQIQARVDQVIAAEPTLGGLAMDAMLLDSDVLYDENGNRPQIGAVRMTFEVSYLTSDTNPFSQ